MIARAVAAAAGCVLCASCAQVPRAADDAPRVLVVEGEAAPEPLAAADFLPGTAGPGAWQRVDAQWRAIPVQPTMPAHERARDPQRLESLDGTVDFLQISPDGSLALCATESPGDDASSHFTPPLLLAPPLLSPGQAFESAAEMIVRSLGEKRQRDAGSARRTLRIVRGERIRTPCGQWNATVVQSEFVARLKMAEATHSTTLWIVPGVGALAERWEASVRVFGVPVPRGSGMAVRIDGPVPGTAPGQGAGPGMR